MTPSESPAQAMGAATAPQPTPPCQATPVAFPCASSPAQNSADADRLHPRPNAAVLERRPQTTARRSQKKVKTSGRKKKSPTPGVMSKDNVRRRNRRIAQKIEHGHRPSQAAFEKYVHGAPTISVGLDSADLTATAGGYVAKNASKKMPRDSSKEELVEQRGFTPVEWNGM